MIKWNEDVDYMKVILFHFICSAFGVWYVASCPKTKI
jgi:hypothetical protein